MRRYCDFGLGRALLACEGGQRVGDMRQHIEQVRVNPAFERALLGGGQPRESPCWQRGVRPILGVVLPRASQSFPRLVNRIQRWLVEVQRRRVTRVLLVYLLVGWAIIQVADTVAPALGLPAWTLTLVTVLLALGLPVAAIFSWIFDFTPAGLERTPSLEGTTTRRSSLVLLGVALIALMAGGWFSWSRWSGRRELSATTVMVLPFTVQGGGDLQYLREAMVILLSTKLDGAEIRTVDPHTVLKTVSGESDLDPERARALARRVGAGVFILGSVVAAGGEVRLQARLYDVATGGPISSEASAEGSAANALRLVDALAARLLARRLSGGDLAEAAALTTQSLPALKAFLGGDQLYRAANYLGARAAFQRAIDEDSGFALAYYRLSLTENWIAPYQLARPTMAQALQRAQRLTPRYRTLLTARSAALSGQLERAEEMLRGYTLRYPSDFDGWYLYGDQRYHGGVLRGVSVVEARAPLEQALRLDPQNRTFLGHLIEIYASERDTSALDKLVTSLATDTLTNVRRTRLLAGLLAGQRTRDSALAEIRRAPIPGPAGGATLAVLRYGGPAEVTALARAVEEAGVSETDSPWPLARVFLASGRWRDAERLVQARYPEPEDLLQVRAFLQGISPASDLAALRAVESELLRWQPAPGDTGLVADAPAPRDARPAVRLYLIGLLALRRSDMTGAGQRANELAMLTGPDRVRSLAKEYAKSLRAQVALSEGRPADALLLLESMTLEGLSAAEFQGAIGNPRSPLFPPHYERLLRAEALAALRRDQEALAHYGALSEMTTSNFVLTLGPALAQMAELYERIGDRQRSIEYYTRFITLWRNCDPQFRPLVQNAERQLARLVGERK